MDNLKKYITQVVEQTSKLLMAGREPSQDQLNKYINQVVVQMHHLTSNAPAHVREMVKRPFVDLWDFDRNAPLNAVNLSGNDFLSMMHELEFAFGDPSCMEPGAPRISMVNKQAILQKCMAQQHQNKLVQRAAQDPTGRAQAQLLRNPGALNINAPAFLPESKSWKQDLSQKVIPTRREVAPAMSDACKRLPTYEKKDWILGAIRSNRVTVISGDTGCGKSTLIPQLVCDAVNLVAPDRVVVCTQPRRVAAITLAEYVARDRGQELADDVGYQIRFINKFCDHTRLIYATTAIVLRRLHNEPELDSIGCLILDEVHERDVYTDFLLLLLRRMILDGRMPHLKVVIMSATLKADAFADYFAEVNGVNALKPVFIPGRMFPVEDYYWEDACEWTNFCPQAKGGGKGGKKGKKGKDFGGSVNPDDVEDARDAIFKDMTAKGRPGSQRINEYSERTFEACALWKPNSVYLDLIYELVMYFHNISPKGDNGEGAILIFLPGWGDISKLFIKLHNSGMHLKLITLHSLMTPEQQHEAFEKAPDGMRKVILSTNIAEASVTIDDVVYVIDSGIRKERSFDAETGTSSLDTTMVTRANAIQRRGRAGRCQEGIVIHLFPSYKFDTFGESPTPQMLSSSMEEVVLQSKVIHGGSLESILKLLTGSMAAPKSQAVDQAVELLTRMDCLTPSGVLTVLGRAVAAIPVQPNVAKMLLLAGAFRCIKPAAVVAAVLAVKNPFQQTVGQKKTDSGKEFFNKGFGSDHITCVQAYVEWRRNVLRGNGDSFCDEVGLSPETMDMAHMMVQQFVSFMVDAGYDGADVSEGDFGECDPVKRGTPEDALLRCAMTAGFWPNACVLYKGNAKPYWYTMSNEEVSPFLGSINANYQMTHKDGEEFMIYSDAMKMGRFNSIMDSTLIFSPFALLFCKALAINREKGEIRFDHWYAYCDGSAPWVDELLKLRREVLPRFKECIEERELSMFPKECTDRMAKFVMQPPMTLRDITAVTISINDELKGPSRTNLSIFEWPGDESD